MNTPTTPYEPAQAALASPADEPFKDLLQSWDALAASTATNDWDKGYRRSRAVAAQELRAAIKRLHCADREGLKP